MTLTAISGMIVVHVKATLNLSTPKPQFFFILNKSLHLFETYCVIWRLFQPNLDFLKAVKVTKSSHHLSHDRASKGNGSIPYLTSKN